MFLPCIDWSYVWFWRTGYTCRYGFKFKTVHGRQYYGLDIFNILFLPLNIKKGNQFPFTIKEVMDCCSSNIECIMFYYINKIDTTFFQEKKITKICTTNTAFVKINIQPIPQYMYQFKMFYNISSLSFLMRFVLLLFILLKVLLIKNHINTIQKQ